MRGVSGPSLVPPSGIERQIRQGDDKFVVRKFPTVAKAIWVKPAAVIASIENCDIRTAQRILRGEGEISARLLLAVCIEMVKPID